MGIVRSESEAGWLRSVSTVALILAVSPHSLRPMDLFPFFGAPGLC
jgi:hypothetical protein